MRKSNTEIHFRKPKQNDTSFEITLSWKETSTEYMLTPIFISI